MSKGENQAETEVVRGTLTLKQVGYIDSLIGELGSNRQDVIGKILSMWIFENKNKTKSK